jgi:hypothetical protein
MTFHYQWGERLDYGSDSLSEKPALMDKGHSLGIFVLYII